MTILQMLFIVFSYVIFHNCLVYGLRDIQKLNNSLTYGSKLKQKQYIVYMGSVASSEPESLIDLNHDFLASYVGSVNHARSRIVYHYHRSFRGFSAMLTPEEANEIRKHKSVVSVFENFMYKLQTTRSWDFLVEAPPNDLESPINTEPYRGLYELNRNNPKDDVVIGSLDTGIWAESPSFDPSGYAGFNTPPKYYKGNCVEGENAPQCNGKLVGARFYVDGYKHELGNNHSNMYLSPRDDFGHGTHTISTAAGRDVSVFIPVSDIHGIPVKGGAPNARIAVYKTCWNGQCSCADLAKGLDDAISDNVDIITLSLGPALVSSYFEDCVAIGALHAFMKGILVVAAGGNSGTNGPASVRNLSPWILTVGATSTDREFISDIVLVQANGMVLNGLGLNNNDFGDYEVVLADANHSLTSPASFCKRNQVSSDQVKGKIVVCILDEIEDENGEKAAAVNEAGGVGMILVDYYFDDTKLYSSSIPHSVIGGDDFQKLLAYMSNFQRPTVQILSTKSMIHNKPAPKITYFSSKGPNALTPEIIKPDIVAPGLNIIAAWLSSVSSSYEPRYELASGTSMACPHVSGVAAVLKSTFRSWTPSMIKSALMTTATWYDNTGNRIRFGKDIATPFDIGSGLLVPDLAFSPGLVYDVSYENVVQFLCSQASLAKLNPSIAISGITKANVQCPNSPFPAYNLNYPSIAIDGLGYKNITVSRTVTLVAESGSPYVYRSEIYLPKSIAVSIDPPTLDFSDGLTKTYQVTFRNINSVGTIHGRIIWTDDYRHFVKSPVVLFCSP